MSNHFRPICKICNVSYGEKVGTRKDGSPKYRDKCSQCHGSGSHKDSGRRIKGKVCEFCGFIPVHPCQLDVDHIDGNKKNTKPENQQTICANCHRLKTLLNKDWVESG